MTDKVYISLEPQNRKGHGLTGCGKTLLLENPLLWEAL